MQAVHPVLGALSDVAELLSVIGFAGEFLVEDVAARPFLELTPVFLNVKLVKVGIGKTLEVGANDGLRLIPFRNAHGFESAF